jgi:hypothetical protein
LELTRELGDRLGEVRGWWAFPNAKDKLISITAVVFP